MNMPRDWQPTTRAVRVLRAYLWQANRTFLSKPQCHLSFVLQTTVPEEPTHPQLYLDCAFQDRSAMLILYMHSFNPWLPHFRPCSYGLVLKCINLAQALHDV